MDYPWHSMALEEVLETLESDGRRGLSREESRSRLSRWGENRIRQETRKPLVWRIFSQLRDPMILVLLAAAGVSLWVGGGEDWVDAAIILAIVAFNTVLSVTQEDSAHRALEALQKLSAPRARVVRGGQEEKIDSAQVVPGDLVLLGAGDYVPADGRLVQAADLQADESAMTGESVPVRKRATERLAPETPLADRKNMVIGGTVITGGRGRMVVTATGMDGEMGRIAGMLLGQKTAQTPLQRKMGEVSRVLSLVCVGVCALTFALGSLQHREMMEMFLVAVALAVAAIPEGLPAIVTIVLAMGVSRMAKRRAVVKKLPAVETLGCASVICSDKTGTLTQNKMTVMEVWTPGNGFRREALTLGVLCSDVEVTVGRDGSVTTTGDPTEGAIAELAAREELLKSRLERLSPRRGEVPFDSVRKRMSTLHVLPDGAYLVAVKGAPEMVLPRCTRVRSGEGEAPMTKNQAAGIAEVAGLMAGRALRVLAVAVDKRPAPPVVCTLESMERNLTFVGLIGMIDPPRPEAAQAVARCAAAGIRPVMITGDHKRTAVAIARQLAIFQPGDRAIDGAELDFLPQQVLEEEIEGFSVFARVTPEHKMRIVRALQRRGHVVAMTGDGVNDAPALKAADIGCAMGQTGTDVAKGAADMILVDDNFATVVEAVEQGRGIYANIRKAIHYLLSCNIGEVATISLAIALTFPQSPLSPVQLLWLNLVTDSLPALALGVEPVEKTVMEQTPRGRREPLFSRAFSWKLAWQGALVGGVTLAAYQLGLVLSGTYAAASTMAFATLTLSQLFHALDVRSETDSLWSLGMTSNPAMTRAFLAGLALQGAVLLLPPLQGVFSVVPLPLGQWMAVLLLAVTPMMVCEGVKAVERKRKRAKKEPASVG